MNIKIINKTVAFLFLLVISFIPSNSSKASSEMFNVYHSKQCPEELHIITTRLITSCETGAPIRIDFISEEVRYTSRTFEWCDGFGGFCFQETSEPDCPSDSKVYEEHRLNPICI